MMRFFCIVKGIVSLALIAFLVMVVVGVYTALDSATSGYGKYESAVVVSESTEL